MPRARRDVENALVSKGFVEGPGDHHFLIYYTKAGVKTIARTKTSRSGRDIPDNLLGQMAKQCKVSKQQFLALVDCGLSRDGYEDVLVATGQI